uniref:Uncharacterized protein n=1 Tax=Zea mays TaxID=4577 RepID=C0PKT4_MAIZE|nr:unknown [Zea mays]
MSEASSTALSRLSLGFRRLSLLGLSSMSGSLRFRYFFFITIILKIIHSHTTHSTKTTQASHITHATHTTHTAKIREVHPIQVDISTIIIFVNPFVPINFHKVRCPLIISNKFLPPFGLSFFYNTEYGPDTHTYFASLLY